MQNPDRKLEEIKLEVINEKSDSEKIDILSEWKLTLGRDICGIARAKLVEDTRIEDIHQQGVFYTVPKDSDVTIWTVSKFGDVAINDRNCLGYTARVAPRLLKDIKILKIPGIGWKERWVKKYVHNL